MAPPAPFSVHQVTHKTISKPAAAAHAKDFESDPHNLWLFYEHPRLLTIDKFTGTANLYEIVPGKEPRQLITIDHVPGTPPGHPFVKITDDWVIFWTEVTLSSTALSIYDIRTGKEIGSHMVDGGRTNLAGILYENGKLVLTLEDPKTTTAVPTVKGRRKNHLAVLEFNKSQGEFVRIADYWPSEKSVAESMYDGPVIPLHITKSNELIAAHSKHPSGTAEILKWSLSDKSGKAVPTEIALESTRGKDYGANSIDYAAHLYIPTLNSLIVAHSQRVLDSADSNPQIAIRSIDPSTLKVNWTANVEHGVGHLHFNSESGLLVVTSGQEIGGATVLDAKSGKLVQSAKLKERDLRSVGSSPGGEEIVLLDRQRKIEVVPVAEFAKSGVAGARSFTLPGEVFKSTKEADSWIRQSAVGSKTIVLAQATSNNWAVVHWEGARPAPAA